MILFLPDLHKSGREIVIQERNRANAGSDITKLLPQCNKKTGNIDAEKMICYTEC